MDIKVKLRYLKIAPRKVRLSADAIRGESAVKAKSLLTFMVKKPSEPLLKLLNSGIASAKNEYGIEESKLYISEIRVDEAPKIKRWMPRARGSASPIQKKSSHITLTLSAVGVDGKKKKKVKAVKVSKVADIKDVVKKDKWQEKGDSIKAPTDKSLGKKIFRRKSI
ncbi:MAG: 50S ribosomal protein L22 [Candidatus Pacebacteria bacterium]|nr:50S ribosomal protein L22 [Candidatus Paceibacterota bacterium]